jgi:O-acetyl-ADP-ribose deacetylase (regulator of RNase III)
MKEARGDLWEYPADAYAITTNLATRKDGSAVLGRGVALQAKERFPRLEDILGRFIRKGGTVGVFETVFHRTCREILLIRLVVFPVKYHWSQKGDYDLIRASTSELVKLTNTMGWQTVALPRPGCGNGGLPWIDGVAHDRGVRAVVRPILDDRFVVVWDGEPPQHRRET